MFTPIPTPAQPDWVTNPQNYATDTSGALVTNRFGIPESKLDTTSGGMSLMQTLSIMVAIVAPEAVPALAEYMGVSTAAAGAIYGGTANAVATAANGGNLDQVVKAGGTGAASGFVGSEVGQLVGGAPEQAGPFVDSAGNVIPGPGGTGVTGLTGSDTAGRVAGATAGGATTGFTRAELGGSNLQSALRQGAIGGVASGAGALLFPSDSTDSSLSKTASNVGKSLLSSEISKLLTPTTTTSSRGGTTTTAGTGGAKGSVSGPSGYGGGSSTGEGGYTPGSQALSQVLNLGSPTSAYSDTGAGGEKTSPETGGKPQNVWNLASLRVKDATGGEA
jgi:hypothetical protein